jgi:outer membrane lipoprotein carrier protein
VGQSIAGQHHSTIRALRPTLAGLALWALLALLASTGGFTAAPLSAQPAQAGQPAQQASPASANHDDSAARAVAQAVQAFYDQTRDVSATFHQTYVNKLYKRTDRSAGRVVFKKPGMMRWDYNKPSGKVIASSGKALTVFEPGEDGEPGQVIEQAISQAQLPQALAFLMGTGRLEDDFTFRLLDGSAEGFTSGDVLELRPRAPTPHFERIVFYVERAEAVRGLVRRLLIVDSTGNRNRFDFTGLKFNSSVDASVFKFTPPKGTRRVQM